MTDVTRDERGARRLLLVGSVPLESSEAVFRAAATELGNRLSRVPDGETGFRSYWVQCQQNVLVGNRGFEPVAREGDPRDRERDSSIPRFRLVGPSDDVEIGPLGYADWAIESHRILDGLQRQGIAPAHWKLQVCLPTPHAFVQHMIATEHQEKVEPLYEARMAVEIAEILNAVPADRLAIQWDVASEFASLEGVRRHYYADPWPDIVGRLTLLSELISPEAELGFHLCYGDLGHKHFTEPTDTGNLTRLMNEVSLSVTRKIDWFHLPVPRGRSDDAYFEPLADLDLQDETEVYLGLIHLTDGLSGSMERIKTAERHRSDFGLATECGFGRRPASAIPELLRLHARIADANAFESDLVSR